MYYDTISRSNWWIQFFGQKFQGKFLRRKHAKKLLYAYKWLDLGIVFTGQKFIKPLYLKVPRDGPAANVSHIYHIKVECKSNRHAIIAIFRHRISGKGGLFIITLPISFQTVSSLVNH